MKWLNRLFFLIVGLVLSVGFLIFHAQNASATVRIPVLMYHHFSDDPGEAASPMAVTSSTFEEQLKYLKEQNFNTLTYDEYVDILNGRQPMAAKPVLITIDDGYESNYVIAYPLLKKYGLKASINVVVSSNPDIYGEGFPGLPHMNWSQMKEMQASGMVEFHNHTYNLHHSVDGQPALLSPEPGEGQEHFQLRVYDDLKKAKNLLESQLGGSVLNLAYPYGAWDQRTMDLGILSGHQIFSTYDWGYTDGASRVLPRILIDDIPLEEFACLVEGKKENGNNP